MGGCGFQEANIHAEKITLLVFSLVSIWMNWHLCGYENVYTLINAHTLTDTHTHKYGNIYIDTSIYTFTHISTQKDRH